MQSVLGSAKIEDLLHALDASVIGGANAPYYFHDKLQPVMSTSLVRNSSSAP
jgi:hypothetical protein